jgi:hypothetical protein
VAGDGLESVTELSIKGSSLRGRRHCRSWSDTSKLRSQCPHRLKVPEIAGIAARMKRNGEGPLFLKELGPILRL